MQLFLSESAESGELTVLRSGLDQHQFVVLLAEGRR